MRLYEKDVALQTLLSRLSYKVLIVNSPGLGPS